MKNKFNRSPDSARVPLTRTCEALTASAGAGGATGDDEQRSDGDGAKFHGFARGRVDVG